MITIKKYDGEYSKQLNNQQKTKNIKKGKFVLISTFTTMPKLEDKLVVMEDKTLIKVVRLPKRVDKMPIKMVWLLENVAKKTKIIK